MHNILVLLKNLLVFFVRLLLHFAALYMLTCQPPLGICANAQGHLCCFRATVDLAFLGIPMTITQHEVHRKVHEQQHGVVIGLTGVCQGTNCCYEGAPEQLVWLYGQAVQQSKDIGACQSSISLP